MARSFAKAKDDKEKDNKGKKPITASASRQMVPSTKDLTPSQVHKQIEEIRARTKIHRVSPAVEYWFPFGIPPLDCCINQGLPGGRLVEFSGPERSGKSTLAARLISQAQAQGGRGDYFDLEMGTTVGQLQEMGNCSLDREHFEFWAPDTAEQCFQAIDDLIPVVGSTGKPSVIVLDSVPGLVSVAELMADYTDETQLAAEARLLKKFCRKNLVRLARFPHVIVVLINHLAVPFKVGMFEKPEPYTPGGRSTRYYSTVRLRFDSSGEKDTIDTPGGKIVARERPKIYLWKNRVGSAHRAVSVPLNFVGERETASKKGFDAARCCLEFLKDEKVLVHPVNVDLETGKETVSSSYWKLDGTDGPNRYMKDWIRLYNTDPETQALVDGCVLEAARQKWTPDTEPDYVEGPASLEDLANLGTAESRA